MLEIKNVSKQYKKGAIDALKDISFTVKKGEFVALLGQNGAGKSTLINILAGNVKKSKGTVKIGGIDLDKNELDTKKKVGVVHQEISFDYVFSVDEVLRNQSGYFGLKDNNGYINELLETLSLTDKKNDSSRSLSGGMKRRLLIAKALVHRPDLLILDEPTAGVDIGLRHQLYDFLNELHKKGTTIILTTHYLEEAEKLCDRVIVIDQGKIVVDENKKVLMKNLGAETLLEFDFSKDIEIKDIAFLADFNPRFEGKRRLQLKVLQNEIGVVFQKMADADLSFSGFNLEPKKLENIYLQIVNGKAA
ncbi:MAG: ABC transporter ATP-binding protein [Desulfobacterales bacterium]|nr:ABC transporter ATP-binding protein [Desulfobacterales bacterium]